LLGIAFDNLEILPYLSNLFSFHPGQKFIRSNSYVLTCAGLIFNLPFIGFVLAETNDSITFNSAKNVII